MLCRNGFLLPTIVATVGAASPVFAQDATALPEIVVTAERRAANVQRTPIAISTVDGQALAQAGVQNAAALTNLVPGLEMRNNTSGSQAIFIRGVGADNRSASFDQANGFFVDQVTFGRGTGPDGVLYDVSRIEVLKGPQGTLYGRNATAGAVNVITNHPILGDTSGYVNAGFGNYSAYNVQGAVNLPAGTNAAFRFAGNRVKRDGYFKDGSSDQDLWAARGHFLWEPSTTINLLLSADYSSAGGRGPGYVPHGPAAGAALALLPGEYVGGDPWLGNCSPQVNAYTIAADVAVSGRPAVNGLGPRIGNGPQCDNFQDNVVWGASAALDVKLGFATWTTVAGYRHTDNDYRFYWRWEALFSMIKANQYTLESRLASQGGGPLTWIVGGFLFREKLFQSTWNELSSTNYSHVVLPRYVNDSWAVFGQATYSVTDAFRLTGGIRYTEDKKSNPGALLGNVPREGADYTIRPAATFASAKFPSTTYRVGAELDVTSRNLLYATVSTGYHSGGLIGGDQTGPLNLPTTYAAEKLKAYALGSKNRFFGGSLQLNTELFYWDYRNLQQIGQTLVNCLTCVGGTTISIGAFNAGKAHILGLDTDLKWLITPNDLFIGNIYWNDSKYDRYRIGNIAATAVNADGRRIVNAPQWVGSGSYQHTFDLGSGARVVGGSRVGYRGAVWMGPRRDAGGVFTDAKWTVDLDATYYSADKRWSVQAYVRNVFDSANPVQGAGNLGDRDPTLLTPYVLLAPPRTYGMTLNVAF